LALTDDLIIVKAKIYLKTHSQGGRENGILKGYRPNHVFENLNNKPLSTYIGDINFDNQKYLLPGETKIVTVRFLKIPEIEKYMHVGQRWFINEGGRNIGEGEIISL
jgi:translation elongation factor EF-Tu-like GTPase